MATTCHAPQAAQHPYMKSWSRPGVWTQRRGLPSSTCSPSLKTTSLLQNPSTSLGIRHSLFGHQPPFWGTHQSLSIPRALIPKLPGLEPFRVLAFQSNLLAPLGQQSTHFKDGASRGLEIIPHSGSKHYFSSSHLGAYLQILFPPLPQKKCSDLV